MGNHTIDCRFCGEDQRNTLRCCAEAVAEEEAAERRRRQWEQALQEGLQRYGLSCWNGQVNASDALKALDKLAVAIVGGRSGRTAQPMAAGPLGVCEELTRLVRADFQGPAYVLGYVGRPPPVCDCYDDGVGPALGPGCRARGEHFLPLHEIRPGTSKPPAGKDTP